MAESAPAAQPDAWTDNGAGAERQSVDTRLASRGVIKSSADGSIEDIGPLTRTRMETVFVS